MARRRRRPQTFNLKFSKEKKTLLLIGSIVFIVSLLILNVEQVGQYVSKTLNVPFDKVQMVAEKALFGSVALVCVIVAVAAVGSPIIAGSFLVAAIFAGLQATRGLFNSNSLSGAR